MPNGKGKRERGAVKSFDKFRYKALYNQIKPYTSALFREQHIVDLDDAESSARIWGIATRDVRVSTAILLNRGNANRIVSIGKYWNSTRLKPGERVPRSVASPEKVAYVETAKKKTLKPEPRTGEIYTSPWPFELVQWSGGRREEVSGYVKYSMVQDMNSSRFIIHHLDDVERYDSMGRPEEWALESEEEGWSSEDESEFE